MSKTVLLLGSGAREHALAWKLSQSNKVKKIWVAPGNGGTHTAAGKISNLELNICHNEDTIKWCRANSPDLVVVGPENPLDRGIADELRAMGIPCFGPGKEAAQIECSKAFAKDFMKRHSIPTASYGTFASAADAKSFVRTSKALVVKASGLAAGKGVVVGRNDQEAFDFIDSVLVKRIFGDAGNVVVVEELLEGPEVSVLAFSDGVNVAVMPPAQDHKRAYDGDEGPNTGGMGAYCPCEFVDDATLKVIETDVIKKTIDCLRREGKPFIGTLFAGLILTKSGPKVLEFNCRFGDPETQSVLPLLDSDLYDILMACCNEKLHEVQIKWKSNVFACGVVIASQKYPASAIKGQLIGGLEDVAKSGLISFHAGTEYKNNQYLTAGGRILTVVAIEDDLVAAARRAQSGSAMVKIDKAFYRKDIAKKAIDKFHSGLDYKSSGVDIEAGDRLVDKIKQIVKRTHRTGAIDSIGGFGAMFDLKEAGYTDPILVSGTDGVGTKLKLAIEHKKFDTVGIDLVAMCINDILVQGAEPLYFLDYFACSKLDVNHAAQVITGIAEGCRQSNCALIGGETAEMPGMYAKDDFDLAGFAVGAVDRSAILPKLSSIGVGDSVIGLHSSGLHSNGFSLIRKLMNLKGYTCGDVTPFDKTVTFGDALLEPTKIYVKSLLPVIKLGFIKALSHITGGGLLENIPRILPKHLAVEMHASKWNKPNVFKWVMEDGNVAEDEMLKTFNCGLGMVLIVNSADVETVLRCLKLNGDPDARLVGEVVERRDRGVIVHDFASSLKCVQKDRVQKKRVAVLISGSGTNLQALIDHTQNKANKSMAEIVLVISNIDGVEGLNRAKRAGIETKFISHKGHTRRDFDMLVNEELVKANIEIVCLAGFMRIISNEFVKIWSGQMLNIHPSLLPLFKGLATHKQALDAGVRVHGSTVHFVDNDVDTGAIILQDTVPVLLNDDEHTLQERVKTVEHKIFPRALELLASGQVSLNDKGKVVWQ